MNSRLNDIAFHFEQGGVVQTDDARWLIQETTRLTRLQRAANLYLKHKKSWDNRSPYLLELKAVLAEGAPQ